MRLDPRRPIEPMFEDPAKYRASCVPLSLLIPGLVLLLFVLALNLVSWLGSLLHP